MKSNIFDKIIVPHETVYQGLSYHLFSLEYTHFFQYNLMCGSIWRTILMKIGICQISLIKFLVFSYFYFIWVVIALIFIGNKLAVSKI